MNKDRRKRRRIMMEKKGKNSSAVISHRRATGENENKKNNLSTARPENKTEIDNENRVKINPLKIGILQFGFFLQHFLSVV
jgi:hypothetical protein